MRKNVLLAVLWAPCLYATGYGSGLTLDRFLSDAIKSHPEVEAMAEATRQVYADTLQAGLPENPELGMGFFQTTQGNNSAQSVNLTWPWRYGLRSARTQSALADGHAAKSREMAMRLAFNAEAAAIYVRLQVQNRRFQWQDSAAGTWKALVPIADKAAAAGRLSTVESGQVRLKAVEAERAGADLANERQTLAAAMGYYAGYPIVPDEIEFLDFRLPDIPVLSDSQIQTRLRRNPSLQARDLEIAAAELTVDLSKALANPEIGWTVGYERDIDGQHLLGGEVHLPLQWFQRNQGQMAKSRSALNQARLERQAEFRRLQAEVRDLLLRLRGTALALIEYEKEIKPMLQAQSRLAREAFQQGRLGVFDLSRIQEEAGQAELAALDRWETYQTLSLRLKALVGENL